MDLKLIVIFLLFFLVILNPPVFAIEMNQVEGEEKIICENTAEQGEPSISGNKVVWADIRTGSFCIYIYDVVKKEEKAIPINPAYQYLYPVISGNKIVCCRMRKFSADEYPRGVIGIVRSFEVYIFDLFRKKGRAIGGIRVFPSQGYRPVIDKDKVVWGDFIHGRVNVINYFDLIRGEGKRIREDSSFADISNHKIVWADLRKKNSAIYMLDLSNHKERVIYQNPAQQYSPRINGNKVVWVDNRNGNSDIYMFDLSANKESAICTNPAKQESPAISGDKIVWVDNRNGNNDIYMFDLSANRERAICTNPAKQESPAISGDKIIWLDDRNGNNDIYMYILKRKMKK